MSAITIGAVAAHFGRDLDRGVVKVVGIIEAAKILRSKTLNHRVRVILFDQEELGLIGPRKWIEAHGLANVAAVVKTAR